jgi:cyanophycinase
LVLVGGGEWLGDAAIDREIVALGGNEVHVLPTAAAYEQPEMAIDTARLRYEQLGAKVIPVMVLNRRDAESEDIARMVASAQTLYLSGGSPLHLRVTLRDSAVLDALRRAFAGGATVVGSSAGAMALTDPMIDPRGGAFTTGLGLVTGMCVVPHSDGSPSPRLDRTLSLATDGTTVVTISEETGLIFAPSRGWYTVGPGRVRLFRGGTEADLAVLATPS